MEKDIKAHVSRGSTWLRLVYIVLFTVIFNVAEVVIAAIVVLQFLIKLFTGESNEQLRGLGHGLATYVYEIISFLTFHTEDMPYPFAPWPKGVPGAAVPARAKTTRKRKPKAPPAEAEGGAGG